jgi:tetratricopeptide (TPR) repeat protein
LDDADVAFERAPTTSGAQPGENPAMRSLELYNRVIGSFDQAAIPLFLAGGAAAILLATLLYAFGKLRPLAAALGVLGVLSLMVGLVLVRGAMVVDTRDEFVTVRYWRFSPAVRFGATAGILCLPATAAFVIYELFRSAQRRRRRALPAHLKEGKVNFAHGDYDAAMSSYNEVLKIAPYLGDAYLHRGCAREAKGDCQAALVDYDQALRNDPQLAGAYLHRGRVRTELGDLDTAEDDFNHYMVMRPNDVVGYLNRGICLAKKGDAIAAAADFHRVLKLTNHSDFADPARDQLAALEALATADHPNGSAQAALDVAPRPEGEPKPS